MVCVGNGFFSFGQVLAFDTCSRPYRQKCENLLEKRSDSRRLFALLFCQLFLREKCPDLGNLFRSPSANLKPA